MLSAVTVLHVPSRGAKQWDAPHKGPDPSAANEPWPHQAPATAKLLGLPLVCDRQFGLLNGLRVGEIVVANRAHLVI